MIYKHNTKKEKRKESWSSFKDIAFAPSLFYSVCQVRDGVEDSNAEIRFFNNKVKQMNNKNHPEGEKTSRQAEDWSTVKH